MRGWRKRSRLLKKIQSRGAKFDELGRTCFSTLKRGDLSATKHVGLFQEPAEDERLASRFTSREDRRFQCRCLVPSADGPHHDQSVGCWAMREKSLRIEFFIERFMVCCHNRITLHLDG